MNTLDEIIKRHEKKKKIFTPNLVFLFVFLVILLTVSLVIKPQLTGFVILGTAANETIVTWDFSSSDDYYYNDSLIDLSNNEAKLKTITNSYTFIHSDFENGTLSNIDIISNGISPKKNTITYYVTQALYDPQDKTSKVNSMENGELEVNEGEILNVEFENALSNGDIMSLYIKDGYSTDIYLCDISSSCVSPGYGLISYDGGEGWYNITITGLSTSTKIFNIVSSKEVEFDYITSNKGEISKAWYKPKDRTSKVDTIGDDHQNVNKNNIFDVFFEGELSDGDVILLYIKDSNPSEIYLCDPSTECNSPGYGKVDYDGGEGRYNITINGLSSPQNSFNIDPPTNVKIDYIEAIHYLNTEGTFTSPVYDTGLEVDWGEISWESNIHSGTDIKLQTRTSSDDTNWEGWSSDYEETGEQITSGSGRYIQFKATLTGLLNVPVLNSITIGYTHTKYIDSGVIETEDITATDLTKWISFTKTESLNNQNIYYYYSLDSGDTWVKITDSDLSSVDTSTGKIKVKAVLSSDGSSTPVIERIELTYTACQENWEINYGDCLVDDTKLKTYTDTNNCGITNDLPSDNGTYIECDYCTSTWQNINNSCNLDDTFTVGYTYTNNCCEETNLESDCNIPENTTGICDYCIAIWHEVNTTCQIDDTLVSYFIDLNDCYAQTGLESDNNAPENNSYACDYCTPNWTCSQYDVCQINNKIPCLNVTDNNSCYEQTSLSSDLYSGNYSEFEQDCVYDKIAPQLGDIFIEPKKVSVGQLVNISSNVIDINDISYVKAILKDSEGRQIKEINLESTGDLFTAMLNTTNMSKGTYVVDFDTEDVLENEAYYSFRGIIALDYSAEDAFTARKNFYANNKSTINASDILLEITTNKTLSNVSLGLAKYSNNIKNNVPEGVKDIRKFMDIVPDEDVKNSTERVTIRIYYNDPEIQSLNINEETLKIYHYNEDIDDWVVLNSTVNTTGNYVEVIVNHFSTYAVFGEEIGEETQDSSSGSGAGSFGWGRFIITKEKEAIKEETFKEIKGEETKAWETVGACDYSYIVSVPDEISFLESDVIRAQIENNGTCLIDKVDIRLSPNISEYVDINEHIFENLNKGEAVEFYLSLKPDEAVSKKKLQAQGFFVKALRNVVESYGGEIITQGIVEDNLLREEKKYFKIYVLKPADFKTVVQDRGIYLVPNMISMLIAIFVLISLIRKKQT